MTIAIELIDLRVLAPGERYPLVFGAFDALRIGEAFEIVSDHDPTRLHAQFERTHPGQCRWRTLQGGPRRWHVCVSRVAGGASPGAGNGACTCRCVEA